MTNKGGRPRTIPDGVEVKTSIPTEVDTAINALVSMSGGISKRALLRQALLAGLQPYALVSPELAAVLQPTTYERKPK